MNQSRYLIILIIFFSCSNVNTHREYYDNGILMKEFQVINNKKHGIYKEYYQNGKIKKINNWNNGNKNGQEIIYDTLGREKLIQTYKNNELYGSYIKYTFTEKYKIKALGRYSEDYEIDSVWEYYINDTLLRQKIFLIRLDTLLPPNYRIKYTESGSIDTALSCFFHIHASNDTISMNEEYELDIDTYCYEFDKMIVIIGDYDKYFKVIGEHFDTLKTDQQSIRYRIKPAKLGKNKLYGRIFKYKDIYRDGESLKKGKTMYFTKEFYVSSDSK